MALPNVALGQAKPFQINGIAFPLIGSNYLDNVSGWTPIPTVIEQLKALGADEVMVTITVGGYNSPTDNLPDPAYTATLRPSDAKIVAFLQQLHAAGFRVLLIPFTNIKFDPNGNLLDTSHAQPTDFTAWINAHTAAMVQMAVLAQQAGVERFSILTDITQLLTFDQNKQAGWLSMIAQIRAVYKGSLTSMLNDDGTIFGGGNSSIDLTQRPIIDALDVLGVIFVPKPLTNTPDPTLSQLVAAWGVSAKVWTAQRS